MRYTATIQRSFQVVGVSGEEYNCVCPWHADKTGHLYVNGEKGLYLCMSCGAKGSLEKAGIEAPRIDTEDVRTRLRAAMAPAREQAYKPEGWLSQYDGDTSYWTEERGLPEETVKLLRLGFDPFANRATLPLRDMHGRILGVTQRRLDGGMPKYQHPKGFPTGKHLYAAWLLGEQRTVGLVEGQVDAAKCWSERVPACATMGSRLTRDQVGVLKSLGVRKVVAMYDNDSAGRRGTVAVYEALRGSGIQFSAGWYRSYWVTRASDGSHRPIKDPDGLSGERLRKMFHSSLTILDWIERSGYESA